MNASLEAVLKKMARLSVICLHLGFHVELARELQAEFASNHIGLFSREGHCAQGYWNSVLVQKLGSLVLMQFHASYLCIDHPIIALDMFSSSFSQASFLPLSVQTLHR